MKRSRPKFKRSITIIVSVLVLLLGYAGGFFLGYRHPLTINQVTNSPSAYGNVVLSGTIQKDAPAGQAGNYLLVSPTGSYMALDFNSTKINADQLIGVHVQITGISTPPSASSNGHNILLVHTLEAKK